MNAPSAPLLFPSLLGAEFDRLPVQVRALHLRAGVQQLTGEVEVERGDGWLSRLCAWTTRLPPAGRGPIDVEIIAMPGQERWTRKVAGHAMQSRLWARDGLLCERLGLVSFGFRLGVEDDALVWRVVRVHALGLPLPSRWFNGVLARESVRNGRYAFDVTARLPLAGLLVHYRGLLEVNVATMTKSGIRPRPSTPRPWCYGRSLSPSLSRSEGEAWGGVLLPWPGRRKSKATPS